MNVPAQRNGVSARLKTNLSWAKRFWLGNALVFLMVGVIYWVGVSLSSNTPVVVFYLACTHVGWLGSFAIAGLLLHCLMGCAPQGAFRYAGVLAGSVFTVILLHDAIGTMGIFSYSRGHSLEEHLRQVFSGMDLRFCFFGLLVSAVSVATQLAVLAATRHGFSGFFSGAHCRKGYFCIVVALLLSQALHTFESSYQRELIPSYADVFPFYRSFSVERVGADGGAGTFSGHRSSRGEDNLQVLTAVRLTRGARPIMELGSAGSMGKTE